MFCDRCNTIHSWKTTKHVQVRISIVRPQFSGYRTPLKLLPRDLFDSPNTCTSSLRRRQPPQANLLTHLRFSNPADLSAMGVPFDYAPERPEHIDTILNGLDRYNPETTTIFQDYVTQQCEEKSYDCYANLALLKL